MSIASDIRTACTRSAASLLVCGLGAISPVFAANMAPVPATKAPSVDRAASAAPALAQAELDAIRKALIDKALEGPTRVRAWAWVDENGALRERNEMTSDVRVRGVRVQSYVDIDKKLPKASIEANLAQGPGVQCRYTQGQWRLPMSVHKDMSAVNYAPLQPVASAAIEWTESRWRQALQRSQRFEASPAQVDQLTPYQRALWGAVDSQVGWRAQWRIQVHPVVQTDEVPGAVRWLSNMDWSRVAAQTVKLVLRLEVSRESQRPQGATSQVVWSAERDIVGRMESTDWTAPRLTPQTQEDLAALAAEWAGKLDKLTQCDPLQYDVIAFDQGGMRINGGTNAGVQIGDRVVVMDAATVPSQVWDQGSLERVMIARVEKVDAYGAQLKALAGRAPQGDGRWVALPY